MYEVRVEADFSAAHFLKDYNGKCENLHGHNYKVYVHAKGKVLNEGGMLFDFTRLKKELKTVLDGELDHRNLNDNDYFMQNPSAERIATYIYERLTAVLPELKKTQTEDKPFIYAVDVFETDTSRARYIPD